jgi:hypothetical protein
MPTIKIRKKRGRKALPPQKKRKCSNCMKTKSIDEFHANKTTTSKTKKTYVCKKCSYYVLRRFRWNRELKRIGIDAFREKTKQMKKTAEDRETFEKAVINEAL